jgi:hypothetical protein
MPFEYKAIRKEAQETLIQFLDAELKLGGTFTDSALLAHSDGHLEHYEQAKHFPKRAFETADGFKNQVVDATARNEIGERLALLQKHISAL